MEYPYTDEKWKPSKTDSTNYYSSTTTSTASLMRSISQKTSSTSKSPLLRSFSQKSSSFKSPLSRSSSFKPSLSRNSSFKPAFSRSSSFKSPLSGTSSPKSSVTTTNSKSLLSRSSSLKCSEFTRKCSTLAKEQRARFYIVKRCVKMLVFWKKNADP